MGNVRIVVPIDAKISDGINKQLDNLEERFAEIQSIGNKGGFGKKIKEDVASAKSEIAQLREEFKDIYDGFKNQKLDTKEFDNFVESMKASIAGMNERVSEAERSIKDLETVFKAGQNTTLFEKRLDAFQNKIDDFIKKTQDGITALVDFNKMVNTNVDVKAKGDTSDLEEGVKNTVNSFSFKDGEVKVPIVLDTTQLSKLKKKYNEIIGVLQQYADKNPVDVTMRLFPLNETRAGAKEVSDSIKNIQAQIASLPEGELKSSISSLYGDLEKEFQKALRLKIIVDLGETQQSIKQRIKELNDAIKEQGFTIYPDFKISDENADEISKKLTEIQQKISLNVASELNILAESLTKLYNTDFNVWSQNFTEGLDKIENKLNVVIPLINQLVIPVKSNNKSNQIKQSIPDNSDINILVEFTNAMKSLRESLKSQQNLDLSINLDPLIDKLDNVKATVSMVHSGIGNLQSTLANVKNTGGLQLILESLQKIENIISEINENKGSLDFKINPDVDIVDFMNEIQKKISQSGGVQVPISVLEASIDDFIRQIQFSIDSRLTNGDIGIETFMPSDDEEIGNKQITSLNKRIGSLKEKIESVWESWYSFAQASISATNISKTEILGVINKLEELSQALQYVSTSFSNIDFSKQLGDIDVLKNLVNLEKSATASSSKISSEAKAMGDVYDKALRAAEAKEKFAGANKQVLESIISSLSALNSEGKGFENLNNLINNLARNKDDRITNMVANLKLIRDTLNTPIENNSFIKAIQELASQGDSLKDLATVLKASQNQINKAKQNVNKRYESYISETNKNFINQVENDLYDADFLLKNGNNVEQFKIGIQNIVDELTRMKEIEPNAITEADVDLLRQYHNQLKQIKKEATLSENKKANENGILKNLGQINELLSGNTKLSFRNTGVYRDLINLQNEFKNFDTSRPQSELKDLTTRFLEVKSRFNELSETFKGDNLFITFVKRLHSTTAQLIAQYLSFQDIVRYIRSMATTIIDLDTQLVDLRKTTTMSATELERFYNSSSDVAKQLGVTTSEIISQASAWSRLGYSSQEAATKMAKLSSQFASISPGMDTESATDALVSTMQAYKIGVEDVQRTVMDNINAIGNTMATTNAEIGEMLQRSSAAMKAANNTLEETIALESAAVEITRNAETTGTAFRTISMRIRGKQSLPPYGESYMLCA